MFSLNTNNNCYSRLVISWCLVLAALASACGRVATDLSPQPTNTVPIANTPQPVETPGATRTTTSETPLTVIASPSAVPTDRALPDLLVSVGQNEPTISCVGLSNGQILLITSSGQVAEVFASGEQVSYSQPAWSPDGQQVAFVKSDAKASEDSLWIVRADGTDLRQVGIALSRPEHHPEPTTCVRTAGILDLFGWSADGIWLAFTYFHQVIENGQSHDQVDWYVTNVVTGQTQLMQQDSGLSLLVWSPHEPKLALVNDEQSGGPAPYVSKTIQLLSLTEADPKLVATYSISPQLPSSFLITALAWGIDTNSLFVGGFDTASKPRFQEPRFLWEVDLNTGQWVKKADLEQAAYILISPDASRLAQCVAQGTNTTVKLLDVSNTVVVNGSGSPDIDCQTAAWLNIRGVYELTFTPVGTLEVWRAVSDARSLDFGKLIGLENLNIPSGSAIYHLSWRPSH